MLEIMMFLFRPASSHFDQSQIDGMPGQCQFKEKLLHIR